MNEFIFNKIGIIRSPYKEKFAVPRQPGLIDDGYGELVLLPPYNQSEIVRGLQEFSHLWIIFVFHQIENNKWRPTVRPPRLGGNTRMGVFATRSTFRPNPIGMSLVELKSVYTQGEQLILKLGNLDLIDGTPVLDIKPYLPFVECKPHAHAGFAQQAPCANMPVIFSEKAEKQLSEYQSQYPDLRRFVTQLLAQDPRPAYRKSTIDKRHYATWILDFNLCWKIVEQQTEVISIDKR